MRHWKFVYVDQNGLLHTFFVTPYYDAATPCNYSPVGPGPGAYEATASGIFYNPVTQMMIVPGGEQLGYFKAEDANGNELSWPGGDYVDTVGRRVSAGGTSSTQAYQYEDSNGTQQTITENLQTFNIKTNFGCSGLTEFTWSPSLSTSVVLPDGTQYTIDYEQTPGLS